MALVVLGGCSPTDVVSRHEYEGGKIARPNRIIVHDFAATAADVPSWAAVGQYLEHSTPQTAEDIEAGRKLGGEVAQELVAKIHDMGLPAERGPDLMNSQIGDLVIMGYFESVDTGSAIKRVVVGCGSGAAYLQTVAEGFLMTNRGLHRLGSGEIDAGEANPNRRVQPCHWWLRLRERLNLRRGHKDTIELHYTAVVLLWLSLSPIFRSIAVCTENRRIAPVDKKLAIDLVN